MQDWKQRFIKQWWDGVWTRCTKLQSVTFILVFTMHPWPLLKLVWQIASQSLLVLLHIDIVPLPRKVHSCCSQDYFPTLKMQQTKKGLKCECFLAEAATNEQCLQMHLSKHIWFIRGCIKTLHMMQISAEDGERKIKQKKTENLCFQTGQYGLFVTVALRKTNVHRTSLNEEINYCFQSCL